MPNIPVRADAEGLPAVMQITRRLFLKSTPAAITVAGAITLPATAEAATRSPLERYEAALAELKAAAEALDPRIYNWTVKSNGDLTCGLLITAWRTTTEYEGDGWYATHYSGSDDNKVYVERAPEHDRNGERWLRITSIWRGKRAWAFTPESDFRTNYGRKLS